MKKQFIPYELALELKKLGFNEDCLAHYFVSDKRICIESDKGYFSEDYITAPLWQQAFDWFFNVNHLFSEIHMNDDGTFGYLISQITPEGRMDYPYEIEFNSLSEAKETCLSKLIELCKKK